MINDYDLDGMVAIVTGGSQGIGREIASALNTEGASVALAARSDGIYETADALNNPSNALPIPTDITDEDSVQNCIEAVISEFNHIDCLVNNAGIAGPIGPVESIDREEWDRMLAVNVTGQYLMVKHASEHLRKSDRGRIINIASISGKRPLRDRTPYTTSKMALIGMTRTLAAEFADDDVTVNAICPGPVHGPRIEGVIANTATSMDVSYDEAERKLFTDDALLGRMIDASDVGALTVFLASDAGRHITAQDINVDAGTAWY